MPAFNEERFLARMVPGCKKYMGKVVVVDDGSTDRTAMGARKEPQIHSPPAELSACYARWRAGNADEHRYLRDFSLFSGRSGKPPSTQRDAEKNNNPLRSSASSAVNHNHSSFHGGVHMTVTITALWDQLYFHSDTDIHGFTQINGFNNIINIFQPEPATRTYQLQPLQPEAIP